MRSASSARLTWRALRSASEYTATVRIPSRRAVRITRHAISPRLAIRILPNIREKCSRSALRGPGRLALLKEGRGPFLALGRAADLGDALRGLGNQRFVERPVR